MALVSALGAFGRADLAEAGGKGANLGELVTAGFPVPEGFVVTTEAYDAVVRSAGLHLDVESDRGATLRAAFEAVVVPDDVRAAIIEAYAALGGGPVAVRSSATAEDLPGAAFAGQQDTYLNVVGETDLVHAVRRCWGSLWTDRAIAYRRARGVDPAGVRIAVVVQRMVDAEVAGVLFTANPVTGHRDQLVLAANSGLGEAVVSGLVTPDHYVLDRRGAVREWTPGRREVVIRAVEGGGVSHGTDTSPPSRLPAEVLADLARFGTEVAAHFGRPQDIEWAFAGGRVWLLQARPMTALPPPPVRLGRFQRRLGSVLLEYVPVRPYPLDMTTWLPFGPAGLMGKVTGYFGLRGAFEDFLVEQDGVVDRLVPPAPRPTPRILGTPFRLVALARRHDPARWTADPRFVAYLARVSDLEGRDLAAMPWSRLVRFPREVLDSVQPVADLRIAYLPRTGLALARLLLALKLLGLAPLLPDLLLGTRTRTADTNRALEALADRVRHDEALGAAVDRLDLAGLAAFGDFHREFTAFLAEYGHRETVSPILVTPPTWGEAPETVLGLIKVLAAEPTEAVDHAARAVQRLFRHPRLRTPQRRARVQRWIDQARAGIAFREDSHFYFTKPLPVLRRTLVEIGGRLRDAGVLDSAEAVFHLRLAEIEAIADPAALADDVVRDLRAAVRERSARRDELRGVRLIDPALIFPRSGHGDALVSGTPASGGTVTATVKVIREAADFAEFTEGSVLVCPYTNPSWTPLFPRAAAVVVDSGGPASHAAIVAREYGIPAIMGTATGTSVLSDGQLVTVDGDTGRVTAAAPASAGEPS
ncbi:PEP/pyruvate-binding domain-containing protein [Saccharothrix stipae]